jgi:hypothetical protein
MNEAGLMAHVLGLSLSQGTEEYLWGRGATDESIARLGLKTWEPLPSEPEIPGWRYKRGEDFRGWLTTPLYSPAGTFLGFDLRCLEKKEFQRVFLRPTKWCPVFIGHSSFPIIWNGGDVYICEGLFDLFALEWGVPPGSAILATGPARLTKAQVDFLIRFLKGTAKLCFDNDATGLRASSGWVDDGGKHHSGALQNLSRAGIPVYNVHYRAKDPGKVWEDEGAAGCRAAFS